MPDQLIQVQDRPQWQNPLACEICGDTDVFHDCIAEAGCLTRSEFEAEMEAMGAEADDGDPWIDEVTPDEVEYYDAVESRW